MKKKIIIAINIVSWLAFGVPAFASGEEVHASCALGGPLGLSLVCTYGGTGTDIEVPAGDGAYVQINHPSGGCSEGNSVPCDDDSCPEAGGDADCTVVNVCMGWAGSGNIEVIMYDATSTPIVSDSAADTISCADLCGNGTVEGDEECDAGNENLTDGCGNPGDEDACQFQGGGSCTGDCGDGTANEGEECDDGNVSNGDGCSASCEIEAPYVQTCGDGIVDDPEECDDGDTVNGDGCDMSCAVETGYVCVYAPSVCAEASIYTPACGDGIVDGEQCDDGDTEGGDGCSATCEIEAGQICQQAPSICEEDPTYVPACGDGIVTSLEACDDGNVASGDGCSASCETEAGYYCTGAPSSCTLAEPGSMGAWMHENIGWIAPAADVLLFTVIAFII